MLAAYEDRLRQADQSFSADDACRYLLGISADAAELARGRRIYPGEARCWEYELRREGRSGGTLEVTDDGVIHYQHPDHITPSAVGQGPACVVSIDQVIEYLDESHDFYDTDLRSNKEAATYLALASVVLIIIAYLASGDVLTTVIAGLISCSWMPFLAAAIRSDRRALEGLRPWIGF